MFADCSICIQNNGPTKMVIPNCGKYVGRNFPVKYVYKFEFFRFFQSGLQSWQQFFPFSQLHLAWRTTGGINYCQEFVTAFRCGNSKTGFLNQHVDWVRQVDDRAHITGHHILYIFLKLVSWPKRPI